MQTWKTYRWLCFELNCYWGWCTPCVAWTGAVILLHKRYRFFLGIDHICWQWFVPSTSGDNWYYNVYRFIKPMVCTFKKERDSYANREIS